MLRSEGDREIVGLTRLLHVLFLCSRNRLRSPTAERVFADHPGIEVASAGLSPDAEERLGPELVEWAELIFVMEKRHQRTLSRKFGKHLRNKRIVCLDIRDDYGFMDPVLVALLEQRVRPALP